MTTIEPPPIGGHAIFCDDIRFEEGGKLSLIGVYQGVMYIHGDFPFIVPKFGILIRYMEQVADFSHSTTFKVFLPGDPDDVPTLVGQVPLDEMRKAHVLQRELIDSSESKYFGLFANFIFAPLQLKEPGLIRVRAVCGDDVYKIGSLRIEKAGGASPSVPQT
jgi:hypothetical protein